ncbi:MAG TPA: hotdog fold domain-containing protein [Acidimicrobiales bacterium]
MDASDPTTARPEEPTGRPAARPGTRSSNWAAEVFTDHVIGELGLAVAADGDRVLGRAEVVPELCVPGTDALRTSVILTWADVLAGTVTGNAMVPRIPLTLDIEVRVARPAGPGTVVTADAAPVRAGRSVVVSECWFRDEAGGEPLALAVATFVPAPDPTHVFPDGFPVPEGPGRPLAVPLAERLDCRVVEPGVAEMPRRRDALNAVGAIQGGLVAVALEEAAASLWPTPTPLESLTVRYLRPVTQGPARATATAAADVATVRLSDVGTGKLCLFATATPARADR